MSHTITLDITEPAKTDSNWKFNGIVTVADELKKPGAGVELLFYVNGGRHPGAAKTDEQGIATMSFEFPDGKYRIEAVAASTSSKSPHHTLDLNETRKPVSKIKILRPIVKESGGKLKILIRATDSENNQVEGADVVVLDPEEKYKDKSLVTDKNGLATYTTTVSSPFGRKRIQVFSGVASDWTFIYKD